MRNNKTVCFKEKSDELARGIYLEFLSAHLGVGEIMYAGIALS